MNDNISKAGPLGSRIRRLRRARGWSLAELARRAGTSAPTLHRYEGGWDRFELDTLRRLAAALGVGLEIRLVERGAARRRTGRPSRARLARTLRPLFWERRLTAADLDRFPDWVLGRVLRHGGLEEVAAARAYYGDEAVRRAIAGRAVDERTRSYWRLILGGDRASQGTRR